MYGWLTIHFSQCMHACHITLCHTACQGPTTLRLRVRSRCILYNTDFWHCQEVPAGVQWRLGEPANAQHRKRQWPDWVLCSKGAAADNRPIKGRTFAEDEVPEKDQAIHICHWTFTGGCNCSSSVPIRCSSKQKEPPLLQGHCMEFPISKCNIAYSSYSYSSSSIYIYDTISDYSWKTHYVPKNSIT